MWAEENKGEKRRGGGGEGKGFGEGLVELRCQLKVRKEIEPKGFNSKPFFPGRGRVGTVVRWGGKCLGGTEEGGGSERLILHLLVVL